MYFFKINFKRGEAKEASDTAQKVNNWFRKRPIKAFYTEVSATTLSEGALSLMQVSISQFSIPPDFLMDFKYYQVLWNGKNETKYADYGL